MPGRNQVGFEHSLRIQAPPARVLAAFFDARALGAWWDVANAIATPRPLGAYALEWATSPEQDDPLGAYGGVLHGTVIDFRPGRGFLVADCYWLPPEGDPIGPMALDVTCSRASSGGTAPAVALRVVQSGLDTESPRWKRYYELLAAGWPPALEKMKAYLETGQGVWDLRQYE
jgi:uncharacterized protein YndB with AHSA1/START domain